jgi:hypothetical protein
MPIAADMASYPGASRRSGASGGRMVLTAGCSPVATGTIRRSALWGRPDQAVARRRRRDALLVVLRFALAGGGGS